MTVEQSLARRRELRKRATEAEQVLWRAIRGRQLLGVKFRRQHSVGPYFVDLYCAEHALAVELDGGQHFTEEGKAYDERRTAYLAAQGIRVVRFSDSDLFEEPSGVLEALRMALEERPLTAAPDGAAASPPLRGGEANPAEPGRGRRAKRGGEGARSPRPGVAGERSTREARR
jgi:very-short-patch-repair endonuclease